MTGPPEGAGTAGKATHAASKCSADAAVAARHESEHLMSNTEKYLNILAKKRDRDAFQFECVHCRQRFATQAKMLSHAAYTCSKNSAAVAARQAKKAKKGDARSAKKAKKEDAARQAKKAKKGDALKQGTDVRGSEENKEFLFRQCLSSVCGLKLLVSYS